MSLKYNVAVVGATGAVGETLLAILAKRNFPVNKLFPLASLKSQGKTVLFNGKPLLVEDLASFDFSQVQFAFFFSRRYDIGFTRATRSCSWLYCD